MLTSKFPHNWTSKTLRQIAKIGTGGTPLRSKVDKYFLNGTIPWIKTTDLNNGLITNTQEQITECAIEESSCKILPKNTILVAMYGGFRQIGRTGLTQIEAATNQAISSLVINQKEAFPVFVLYWLNHSVGYWKRFAASSRKDPNISKNEVASFPILLPPLPEQKKIAEVLLTWDTAIDMTEQLVLTKKKFKKALMQQLLTGKKRFSRFGKPTYQNDNHPKDWIQTRLGDIVKVLFSNVDKKSYHGQRRVHLCNYLDVYNNLYITQDMNFMEASASDSEIRKFSLKQGDVLITKDSETPDDIAHSATVREPLENIICGYHLGILRPKDGISGLFLGHLLMLPSIRYQFTRIANGAIRFGLGLEDIKKVPLVIPTEFHEQEDIANILMACDYELLKLDNRIQLFKQQKKGLMQKLLTGKVRVKV